MRGHSPSKTGVNALTPAHPSKKQVDLKKMDCRVKPGNDEPFPSNAKRL
jgi:hypothetical protein